VTDLAPLRIGFDATSLLDPPTGVGTFAREVLARLATRSEVEVTAFAVTLRGRSRWRATVPGGVRASTRVVPARLARAAWLRGDQPSVRFLTGPVDVVHGPNFVAPPGGPAAEVITVHDLTALHHPGLCTPDVLRWPPLLRRALRRGAWVHAVSGHVAEEVREAFPEAGDRVVAVANGHTAPAPATARSDGARGRHLAGSDRYVLAVGTVEPRKDLPLLVAAFDALAAADRDLRLVIAGPDGWGAAALTAAIDRAVHHRRIRRLGWVDDDTRWALVRGASVVAYPSRYEGFGLVPLDAMSVGTPVVACAAGAVPEVVGDAARLVPVGDGDGLADALAAVLTDGTTAPRLAAAGLDRVTQFDWDRTTAGLVGLYGRAAAARRGPPPGRSRPAAIG
jgi:glycosyltransferase involved in cell wall biosynthesis